MKRANLKSISIALVIVGSLLGLTGCGEKSSANANTGAPVATAVANQSQTDPNLMTSQQQTKSIDIKSTAGQRQVETQINKNLNNLDKSLNALDKSLGSL